MQLGTVGGWLKLLKGWRDEAVSWIFRSCLDGIDTITPPFYPSIHPFANLEISQAPSSCGATSPASYSCFSRAWLS